MKIKSASETEQNNATDNTCLPRSPCLNTKTFCAPIAIISEKPSASPDKKPTTKEKFYRKRRFFLDNSPTDLTPINRISRSISCFIKVNALSTPACPAAAKAYK